MVNNKEIELVSTSIDGPHGYIDSDNNYKCKPDAAESFFSQVRDALEGIDGIEVTCSNAHFFRRKVAYFIIFEAILFCLAYIAPKKLAGFLGSVGPSLLGMFMMIAPFAIVAEPLGTLERQLARACIFAISLACAIRTVFVPGCSEAMEQFLLSKKFSDKEGWTPTVDQANGFMIWAQRSIQAFWLIFPFNVISALVSIRDHRPSPTIVFGACVVVLMWLDLLSDQFLLISEYCNYEDKGVPIRFAEGANFVIERIGVTLAGVLIARRIKKFEEIMREGHTAKVLMALVIVQLTSTAPLKFIPGFKSKAKSAQILLGCVRFAGFGISIVITGLTTRCHHQLVQACDMKALDLEENKRERVFQLIRSVRHQCTITQACLLAVGLRLGARSIKTWLFVSGSYRNWQFTFAYRTIWLLQSCVPPICVLLLTRARRG